MIIDLKDPNRPCFTKQEVRDMLFERNELKANLFLVKEELAYYQRWDGPMLLILSLRVTASQYEHTSLHSSGKSWMMRDVQDSYSMLCAPPLINRELLSRLKCSAYLSANAARELASSRVTMLCDQCFKHLRFTVMKWMVHCLRGAERNMKIMTMKAQTTGPKNHASGTCEFRRAAL